MLAGSVQVSTGTKTSLDQYSREFIAEKARLRPEDLGLVRTARRSHNQLGLAYQIAFIRLTGRAPGQQPFEILEDLVGYVATELNANPRDLDLYARRRERSVQDICEVVASVMAYGCNIGPETMARVTNDVSYKAIRRLADWQFSEDKLRGALADLVNGISRCDAAEVWGHARNLEQRRPALPLSQEDPEGHVQPSPSDSRRHVCR